MPNMDMADAQTGRTSRSRHLSHRSNKKTVVPEEPPRKDAFKQKPIDPSLFKIKV